MIKSQVFCFFETWYIFKYTGPETHGPHAAAITIQADVTLSKD